MDSTKVIEKSRVVGIIYKAIDEINADSSDGKIITKTPETFLFGQGGTLDSLGLVRLIVAVEETLRDQLNLPITLADEKAMSQTKSPFRSVGSLCDYVYQRILEDQA